jgi:hypothetical protein
MGAATLAGSEGAAVGTGKGGCAVRTGVGPRGAERGAPRGCDPRDPGPHPHRPRDPGRHGLAGQDGRFAPAPRERRGCRPPTRGDPRAAPGPSPRCAGQPGGAVGPARQQTSGGQSPARDPSLDRVADDPRTLRNQLGVRGREEGGCAMYATVWCCVGCGVPLDWAPPLREPLYCCDGCRTGHCTCPEELMATRTGTGIDRDRSRSN